MTTPFTTRFASRVVQDVASLVSLDRKTNQTPDSHTQSGCIIKSRWLRRGGLAAILFFVMKGLFWLGLMWWYHHHISP